MLPRPVTQGLGPPGLLYALRLAYSSAVPCLSRWSSRRACAKVTDLAPPDVLPGKDLAGWRKFSAPSSCGNLDNLPSGEGASEWPSISMSVDGLLPACDRAALHDLGVAAHWKATMRLSRRPNRFNVHLLDALSVSILVAVQAGLVCILALW